MNVRLLFLLGCVLALLAVVFTLGGGGDRDPSTARPAGAAAAEPSVRTGDLEPSAPPVEVEPPVRRSEPGEPDVGHPFDPPLPWGGEARLEGRIGSSNGSALATLRFREGPNEGLVHTSAPNGSFVIEGLVSGVQIVEVEAPGLPSARRTVRLSPTRTTVLEITPLRAGRIAGRVQNERGEPVAGARVTVDAYELATDASGRFETPRETSGRPLVSVEAEGYARVLCEVREANPAREPVEQRYTLVTEAPLEVVVLPSRALPAGEVRLQVVPRDPPRVVVGAAATWVPTSTLTLTSGELGSVRTVGGLAPGEAFLFASHPCARSEIVRLRLVPGRVQRAEALLEPVPLVSGRVLRDGRPVPGVRVEIVADPVRRALTSELGPFGRLVLPLPMRARRSVRSDGAGGFQLGAFEEAAPRRQLRVLDSDGRVLAGRWIDPGITALDIRLRGER